MEGGEEEGDKAETFVNAGTIRDVIFHLAIKEGISVCLLILAYFLAFSTPEAKVSDMEW